MSKAQILIAEDDKVLREVYTKKFSIAGFDILAVENGKEAVKAIAESVPDILIVDLNMPSMDGFAMLEKFPRSKRPFPIIVLTNFGSSENRERAKQLGADDYFVKSEMTIKSLLKMVEGLLKARRMWGK